MTQETAIVDRLKDFGRREGGSEWKELDAESLKLVRRNPFAFLIAVAFDRGMPWMGAWRIPREIDRKGCLDPKRMASMSQSELIDLLESLPRRPRWGTEGGARTLSEAARLVCDRFNGDAGAIWANSSPTEVSNTLQEIYQIGPGIASMATRILHDDFGCFRGQEWQIDVKPDTHLLRVFWRTGLMENHSEAEAVRAARRLSPDYPGALDWPAWRIGESWCHSTGPDCARCLLTDLCPKRISVPDLTGALRSSASEVLPQADGGPVGAGSNLRRDKESSEQSVAVARPLPKSSTPGDGEDPDYSVYQDWDKASEESRSLFRELKTLVNQFGVVLTVPSKTVVSFKCLAAKGHRTPVFAYVYVRKWNGIRVLIHEKDVCRIPLEEGFTGPNDGGKYREIVIRNYEHIRRAEPLLRLAYTARTNI